MQILIQRLRFVARNLNFHFAVLSSRLRNWFCSFQFSLKNRSFPCITTTTWVFYGSDLSDSLICFSCFEDCCRLSGFWQKMLKEFLTTWESHFYQWCNECCWCCFITIVSRQTSCNLFYYIWFTMNFMLQLLFCQTNSTSFSVKSTVKICRISLIKAWKYFWFGRGTKSFASSFCCTMAATHMWTAIK